MFLTVHSTRYGSACLQSSAHLCVLRLSCILDHADACTRRYLYVPPFHVLLLAAVFQYTGACPRPVLPPLLTRGSLYGVESLKDSTEGAPRSVFEEYAASTAVYILNLPAACRLAPVRIHSPRLRCPVLSRHAIGRNPFLPKGHGPCASACPLDPAIPWHELMRPQDSTISPADTVTMPL